MSEKICRCSHSILQHKKSTRLGLIVYNECKECTCTNYTGNIGMGKEFTKAQKYDILLSWMRNNLTDKQIHEIQILIDPLSRKILAYLVK